MDIIFNEIISVSQYFLTAVCGSELFEELLD